MGLRLRRRIGRRPRGDEKSAGGQGRQSRRNGVARPAGSPGLHHHDGSLRVLLQPRKDVSRGAGGRGRSGARQRRAADRAPVRRRRESPAGLRAFGGQGVDAGDDGYGPQSRPRGPIRADAGQDVGRRAFRLRQLSPLHSDVFERGAGGREPQFRGHPRGFQGSQGPDARHRPFRRRLARGHRGLQEAGRRA